MEEASIDHGTARRSDTLKQHIGDLTDFSAAMTVLAELSPERMTFSQGIFFILTAAADLAGRDPTYTDVKEAVGERINASLHTTYKILLSPTKRYPHALGWLTAEVNPADGRMKFLRLTEKGREVIQEVVKALTVQEEVQDGEARHQAERHLIPGRSNPQRIGGLGLSRVGCQRRGKNAHSTALCAQP